MSKQPKRSPGRPKPASSSASPLYAAGDDAKRRMVLSVLTPTLDDVFDALAKSLPKSVAIGDRTYWLRSAVLVHVQLFESPADVLPVVQHQYGSDFFGHTPGH